MDQVNYALVSVVHTERANMILYLFTNLHFGCGLITSVCEHDVGIPHHNLELQDRIPLQALELYIFPDPSLLSLGVPPNVLAMVRTQGISPGSSETLTAIEWSASGLFWSIETTSRGQSLESA